MATAHNDNSTTLGTTDDTPDTSPEVSPAPAVDNRADWRGWYALGATFTILASAAFTHLHAAWIMAVLWVIIALGLVWCGTSGKSRRKFDLYVLVDVGLIAAASAIGILVAPLGGRLIPSAVEGFTEFGGIIALVIILAVAFVTVWLSLRGAALGSHWLMKIILAVCIFVLMMGVTQWGFPAESPASTQIVDQSVFDEGCQKDGAEDLYGEYEGKGCN